MFSNLKPIRQDHASRPHTVNADFSCLTTYPQVDILSSPSLYLGSTPHPPIGATLEKFVSLLFSKGNLVSYEFTYKANRPTSTGRPVISTYARTPRVLSKNVPLCSFHLPSRSTHTTKTHSRLACRPPTYLFRPFRNKIFSSPPQCRPASCLIRFHRE